MSLARTPDVAQHGLADRHAVRLREEDPAPRPAHHHIPRARAAVEVVGRARGGVAAGSELDDVQGRRVDDPEKVVCVVVAFMDSLGLNGGAWTKWVEWVACCLLGLIGVRGVNG